MTGSERAAGGTHRAVKACLWAVLFLACGLAFSCRKAQAPPETVEGWRGPMEQEGWVQGNSMKEGDTLLVYYKRESAAATNSATVYAAPDGSSIRKLTIAVVGFGRAPAKIDVATPCRSLLQKLIPGSFGAFDDAAGALKKKTFDAASPDNWKNACEPMEGCADAPNGWRITICQYMKTIPDHPAILFEITAEKTGGG